MIQTLTAALLAAALAAPRPWGDTEPTHERAQRLEVIATAIALEADAPGWRWSAQDMAWLLFATAYEESGRFRRDVHEGARLGDNGRARCLAQLHQQRLVPRAEWLASAGTDIEATRLCMRLAARVLVASSRCVAVGRRLDEHQAVRIVSAYATGYTCGPIGLAQRRARRWWSLRREWQLPPVDIPADARYAFRL